jgi:ribonucleoside-diphosphate reductase alpha chain
MTLTTSKIGKQDYLGIEIDYSREDNLNNFSLETLKDRYLSNERGETHAQEAFARAAVYGATYQGYTEFSLAQRLYDYSSKGWFGFSTPILSNGGTETGLPISCFLNYVPDSRRGLSDHYDENIWLASGGGGLGGYWGNVRSNGVSVANGSESTGSIPFMHVVDSQMLAFNQGRTRRGSYAAYMDISHPEIEEFVAMRKTTGGDLNRKCLNLHNGVTITDAFLKRVKADESWRLIDPKSGDAIKTVSARDLWWQLLHTRAETGEPYIVNIDRCNEALPQEQQDLGLKVIQSNLCSEITLPTSEERTAVCCLSSVNLEYFDEWKDNEEFISDLITMLDNIIEHFIENACGRINRYADNRKPYGTNYEDFTVREGKEGFKKAAYSAYRERALGLGAMGFHSYLQRNGIPFEGMYATSFNNRAFKHIKTRAEEASVSLGESRGTAPDMAGSTRRNSHLLAIAPNASSSIICGGTSPSIEPTRANVFTHKTLTGSFKVKNKYLEKLLAKKKINTEQTWKDIAAAEGSVADLEALTEEEKEVFKTAPELNQMWVIEHAYQRQKYVCQAQSVNLFFNPPPATAEQEIHDEYLEYVNSVHWAGANKLKSMYYLRSTAARNTENVNIKIPRINLEDGECLSCEG